MHEYLALTSNTKYVFGAMCLKNVKHRYLLDFSESLGRSGNHFFQDDGMNLIHHKMYSTKLSDAGARCAVMLMLAYEVNTDPPQLFNREVQNVVKVNNVYVGRRQHQRRPL